MYMPSQELDIVQNILDSNIKPLSQWKADIVNLISVYGDDMVLYTKNQKFDVYFLLSENKDILMNIEQNALDKNCSMTLKQWKEVINKLIRNFNENTYLYPSDEYETFFLISPMVE